MEPSEEASRQRNSARAVALVLTSAQDLYARGRRSRAIGLGIIGVYHRVSIKHLGRYVHEFTFRLNEGNVSRKTVERLDSFIAAVTGKRLTYAGLIQ